MPTNLIFRPSRPPAALNALNAASAPTSAPENDDWVQIPPTTMGFFAAAPATPLSPPAKLSTDSDATPAFNQPRRTFMFPPSKELLPHLGANAPQVITDLRTLCQPHDCIVA